MKIDIPVCMLGDMAQSGQEHRPDSDDNGPWHMMMMMMRISGLNNLFYPL